jgi:hypothetical protein
MGVSESDGYLSDRGQDLFERGRLLDPLLGLGPTGGEVHAPEGGVVVVPLHVLPQQVEHVATASTVEGAERLGGPIPPEDEQQNDADCGDASEGCSQLVETPCMSRSSGSRDKSPRGVTTRGASRCTGGRKRR